MKKEVALKLRNMAEYYAQKFSEKDREYNFNNEKFEVHNLVVISEDTAAIIFQKDTGKRATMIAFYVKDNWVCFFPKDTHVLGMMLFPAVKESIEAFNFPLNFVENYTPTVLKKELFK